MLAKFTINTLGRSHDSDNPTTQSALRGSNVKQVHEVNNSETDTLERRHCLETVDKAVGNKILNFKFLLKQKINDKKSVHDTKHGCFVCGNEEHNIQDNSFSSVCDYTVEKIILCMTF